MSLLWMTDNERVVKVNDDIFSNLNLDKLLGYKTLGILSCYCNDDELSGRIKIFQRIIGGDLYQVFCKLRSALADLDACYYVFDKSSNQLERIFRARNLYYSYKCVLDIVADIKVNDEVLLMDFKNNIAKMSEPVLKAEKYVNDSEKLINTVSRAKIKVGGGSVVAPSNGSVTWIDEILQLIDGIGITIDSAKINSRSIKPNNEFAIAYCRTYIDEIRVLSEYPKIVSLFNREILLYRDEIEFYISIFELIQKALDIGIACTLPAVTHDKSFMAKGVYDISLMAENVKDIVPNDVFITQDESVFFIIGANGGGKTSYLRAVAINALLATAGCPVFADEAVIYNFNRIYTHFPSDENSTDVGRFFEEKQRIDTILSHCTHDTLVFMNETFSGTDNAKGSLETLSVARKLKDSGSMGLIVTHFNEIPFDELPVLSAVVDDGKRTFIIKRHDTKIKAHANDILKKYSLTPDLIKKRYNKGAQNDT